MELKWEKSTRLAVCIQPFFLFFFLNIRHIKLKYAWAYTEVHFIINLHVSIGRVFKERAYLKRTTTNTSSLLLLWCRDATLRLSGGCGSAAPRRVKGLTTIIPHVFFKNRQMAGHILPFPGLWWAFSERCWPLSQLSAPSPNSAQPSCSADQSLDAGGKEIDRLDRYGDRWGKCINVQIGKRRWQMQIRDVFFFLLYNNDDVCGQSVIVACSL